MKFPKEEDQGNVEYKLIIHQNSEERLQELATQLKYRLEEGGGEAFYIIGVSNDGEAIGISKEELELSILNLQKICSLVNAKIVYKRISEVRKDKFIAEVLIRLQKDKIPLQANIAVMGHVNAGKSTLTGVLLFGKLDDGNGSLRAQVARHLHEVITGRTSSVTVRVIGFDNNGNIVNWSLKDPLDEAEVTLKSNKIIRLIDLGGHERYLRTTLKGLLGYEIDYVMLVVGADDGLSTMGKEHLAIASILKFPIIIVITKIDKYPPERINEIIESIRNVLRIPGINRIPMIVNSEEDISTAAMILNTKRVVPIFKVSNTTGEGLNLLISFLNLLKPKKRKEKRNDTLVYIDEIYNVQGVGTVVLGIVVRGSISVNDNVLIGPTKTGEFIDAKVKSIQVNRVFVERIEKGTIATFAIQGLQREYVRKGMVILKGKPASVSRFKAKVLVLHHPTTIREGYVATLHLYTIRQAARFERISKGILRTGDSSEVELRFLYRPEYIEVGQVFLFREGRTRGIGVITEIA